MGTTMNLAAAILIVLSIIMDGFSVKGGVAGLVLTYTQQVNSPPCARMIEMAFTTDLGDNFDIVKLTGNFITMLQCIV